MDDGPPPGSMLPTETSVANSDTGGTIIGLMWFAMIILMFFAQHHVCDAYFVPAINVFVDRMRASKLKWLNRWGEETVAGATICALGCNGPELFTNLISLFTHSDAGIGVVVGSEIFNLLVITGAAVIAAPTLPLLIDKASFTRDCLFYFLSIVLLYIALKDQRVDATEAGILLFAAAVYVSAVYFTMDIVDCLRLDERASEAVSASERMLSCGMQSGRMHGVDVTVLQILHSRMADGHGGPAESWNMDPTEIGIISSSNRDAAKLRPESGSIGFQFGRKPGALTDSGPLRYQDLAEVAVMSEGTLELTFIRNLVELVTLRVTAPSSEARNLLLERIGLYSLQKPWIHKYDATVVSAFEHLRHAMSSEKGILTKLVAVVEFMLDLLLKSTLFWCDVKDITKESRWPMCFFGAMIWLATFSWMMLEVAEAIHYNIPIIPSSFLGITVCAIGTSFPNAVASVILAAQNKPAAAIANALGSNVQNVFLAMALPWMIYLAYTDFQPIGMSVAGINEGVVWMMGTLMIVALFVLLGGCTLGRVAGYILIIVYVVYLAPLV